MIPNANDGQKRIRKYLSENATPEANPIPKEKSKHEKDSENYVSDDSNQYDIHEEDTVDDRDW